MLLMVCAMPCKIMELESVISSSLSSSASSESSKVDVIRRLWVLHDACGNVDGLSESGRVDFASSTATSGSRLVCDDVMNCWYCVGNRPFELASPHPGMKWLSSKDSGSKAPRWSRLQQRYGLADRSICH